MHYFKTVTVRVSDGLKYFHVCCDYLQYDCEVVHFFAVVALCTIGWAFCSLVGSPTISAILDEIMLLRVVALKVTFT